MPLLSYVSNSRDMSPAASLTVVHADEIVSHPSYAPCHRLSVPGEVGKDISEIKAILQHEVCFCSFAVVEVFNPHTRVKDHCMLWYVARHSIFHV